MTVRARGRETCRRSLILFTCFVLIAGGAPGLLAQSPTAAITGIILDPAGQPAFGFKAVFRDVGSNSKYTSAPTDAAGTYAVQVPLGGRYKLEGVVADDGVTKLPVQEIPPISVLTPGTTRLNVRFANAPAPGAASAAAPLAAPPAAAASAAASAPASKTPAPASVKDEPAKKDEKKAMVPWYKRPGPIVGMVLGGVAIVALAMGGGGGGGNVASPSTPSQ